MECPSLGREIPRPHLPFRKATCYSIVAAIFVATCPPWNKHFTLLLFFGYKYPFSPKGSSGNLTGLPPAILSLRIMPLTSYAPLNLCVHKLDAKSPRPVSWPQFATDTIGALGTPLPGCLTRVSYWCFDMLFLGCRSMNVFRAHTPSYVNRQDRCSVNYKLQAQDIALHPS